MTLGKSKWVLATIWLAGAGVILTLMVGQSLFDVYGARTEDAWSWYLPTVMPSLSLILGVLVADFRAGKANPDDRRHGLVEAAGGRDVFRPEPDVVDPAAQGPGVMDRLDRVAVGVEDERAVVGRAVHRA